MSADDELGEVAKTAEQLRDAELLVTVRRRARDAAIRAALAAGASERATALAAEIAPSYVHRVRPRRPSRKT